MHFLSNRNYGRFSLGGQKYFYLSGDEEVLRGKQGKGGVHCVKTGQALLVGVYEDPMAPAQAGMYCMQTMFWTFHRIDQLVNMCSYDHGEAWRLSEGGWILSRESCDFSWHYDNRFS